MLMPTMPRILTGHRPVVNDVITSAETSRREARPCVNLASEALMTDMYK